MRGGRVTALAMAVAMLAACHKGGQAPAAQPSATPDLETAAIAAGVIPDPANSDLTGLYARDTDRVCLVPGQLNFRIGAYVDYGPAQSCAGSGSATRSGELLHVRFDGADGCEFDARYEGDRIVFPAVVPSGCAKLCHGRASFAALDVALLSNSLSEAAAMREGKGRLLCGG
ncbi:MAG: hypothetical protein ACRCSO_09170 [Sphingomonas sp.]